MGRSAGALILNSRRPILIRRIRRGEGRRGLERDQVQGGRGGRRFKKGSVAKEKTGRWLWPDKFRK